MINNRYQRQISLREIGNEGQEKLSQTKVAVVGCGGLGSIVAPYLAGAGIGTLILIDGDQPDVSNVHRQVFYSGVEKESKAFVLSEHIKKINPNVKVEVIAQNVEKENVAKILGGSDLILECTDEVHCKYLVNDYCALHQIPLVYGAIYKFEGYVSLFENQKDDDVHLRDIFPVPNNDIPKCSEVGVLNTIAGLIGLLQANEALKYILEIGEGLSGYLLTYNALTNTQIKIKCKKAFEENLQSVFNSSKYKSESCEVVPEISWKEYAEDPNKYTLISILENDEHVALDSSVLHIPLSTFTKEHLGKGLNILHCKTGRRSSKLVRQLIDEGVNNIFSLKDYSL